MGQNFIDFYTPASSVTAGTIDKTFDVCCPVLVSLIVFARSTGLTATTEPIKDR